MPCVVILTAIPAEYKEVRAHLRGLREEVHPRGTVYERGRFVANEQAWDVGIVEIGPGNSGAASEAERAISHFKPDIVMFVGIAGGIKDVKIGDVVAATKVYGYESGKAEEKFLPRPEIGLSAYDLEQRAKAEARHSNWQRRIASGTPKVPPQAFVAPIAAGEKVIDSTQSEVFQFLRSNYSDAIAVEMEGLGFLEATRANQQVSAIIIRGISDLIDNRNTTDAAGSKEVAARHASAFAFEILSKLNQKRPTAGVSSDKPEVKPPRRGEIEIFFSYSHNDEALRDTLETHLSTLRRKGIIQEWHDRQISPGVEWENEIDQRLETSHIILLLISADFINSNYCMDKEVKRAMERHQVGAARVIPVILRPCDWQDPDLLFSKLQALPKGGKPITKWNNQDEAFLDVVKGIRTITEEIVRNP